MSLLFLTRRLQQLPGAGPEDKLAAAELIKGALS